jgi:hypothetical protein
MTNLFPVESLPTPSAAPPPLRGGELSGIFHHANSPMNPPNKSPTITHRKNPLILKILLPFDTLMTTEVVTTRK